MSALVALLAGAFVATSIVVIGASSVLGTDRPVRKEAGRGHRSHRW